MPARLEAFKKDRLADGDDPLFLLLLTRLDLVREVKTLIEDIRYQLGGETPIMIVLDMLNRTLVGSESSDKDMSTVWPQIPVGFARSSRRKHWAKMP